MISMKLEQRYSYKKMSTKTKQKMLVIVILQKQLISFQQNEYLWFSYLLHAAFCAYGMNCLVWKHQKCFRDQHTNHNDNCSSISERSSEDYVVNVLPTHWPQNRIRELESLGILRDDQSVHEWFNSRQLTWALLQAVEWITEETTPTWQSTSTWNGGNCFRFNGGRVHYLPHHPIIRKLE